ncbi:hypothetical protein SAMN04487906_0809 [Zhouia amylolytica]|uniref:Tetratricopeptide repeat-containing protein n=1 Tax=Zhouia amylolytica TaxID=376730 RepID=A0A1I6QRH0_9FLAO|nr:hypothetical protein [Zhouia amylolytica]SFS55015.1 hypothetical protein SAMN04487906_0809 [Zhouia amylolytica]
MKRTPLYIIGVLFFLLSCKKESKSSEDVATVEEQVTSKYGCAPKTTDADWYTTNNKAPLIEGLDVLNYPITTKNEKAQQYFNQGLVLAYGFNHAEAARSFYYATQLDPDCAMCYWGYAYVLGPNYNAGMEPDNYERAYKAIQKAKELAANASAKEKDLIAALAERYVAEPIDDRSHLDIAYSDAMKELYSKYPEDPEIAALYAESVMDLHPWDLYTKDGSPKSWTPEIVALLEDIMTKNPNHPGAHHFYIHAVEASTNPERSLKSAAMFDNGLVPGSGHLTHMPSHTYIRTGHYHKGTVANINAVAVDSAYVTACHAQGIYPLAYYPHNYHFLAATATLEGNSHWAMVGAQKLAEQIHPDIMKQPEWFTLQHFYMIPYYVAVKLGKWDDILAMELVTDTLKYPNAVQNYARGMAYLGKGNLDEAKKELAALKLKAQDESLEDMTIWGINSMSNIVQIAEKVLEAELLASEEKYDESIALLKEAVAIEDALNYQEPPDWFFSVRHHLGAVQIEAGAYEDAIATYEEDLKVLPRNGWAQQGMKLAYEKMNNKDKVSELEKLLADSWSTADITITTSRIK